MIEMETLPMVQLPCSGCGTPNSAEATEGSTTVRFKCETCGMWNWADPSAAATAPPAGAANPRHPSHYTGPRLTPRPAPAPALPPGVSSASLAGRFAARPPARRLETTPAAALAPASAPAASRQPVAAPHPVPVPVRTAIARPDVRRPLWSGTWGRILLTLMVVGTVAAVGGAGTLASFNATTTNSSSITTGTIVLGDTVNSGTECLSYGLSPNITAANTSTCSNVFGLSSVSAEPGQPSASGNSATVKVVNKGSLNTTANAAGPKGFYLYAPSSCANTATAGEPFNGAGDLCSLAQIYVQQYSDAAFTTAYKCVYGAAVGATCSGFDSSHTLHALGLAATSASPIFLTDSGGNSASPLISGSAAYFKVFVFFPSPSSSADSYQGVTATLDFTWAITPN
jgi:predicted ribosomally synthesized peptide with SipW-like signal peptide